jgi:hypothetical protein
MRIKPRARNNSRFIVILGLEASSSSVLNRGSVHARTTLDLSRIPRGERCSGQARA